MPKSCVLRRAFHAAYLFIILFLCIVLSATGAHASRYVSPDTDLEWSQGLSFYSTITEYDSCSVAKIAGGISLVSSVPGSVLYNEKTSDIWSGWYNLTGSMTGAAGISSEGSNVYVAIRGTDNALWVDERKSGAWSGWRSWGGSTSSDPVAAKTGVGLDVGVKGYYDNNLWLRREFPDGSLSAWYQIPGLLIAGGLSIAEESGVVLIAARDSSGGVYVIARSSDGTWGSWASIGGQVSSDPAIYKQRGVIYVSAVGSDGSLWYDRMVGGVWQGWQSLEGQVSGRPIISGNSDGVLIGAKGSDGQPWFRIFNLSASAWGGWLYYPWSGYSSSAVVGEEKQYTFLFLADSKMIGRLTYYTPQTLTSSDYAFQDYSIRDLSTGGKELSFYLANAGYKVKMSYTLQPHENYITKTVGVAANVGQTEQTSHSGGVGVVYASVSGQTYRLGNEYIERTFTVSGGVLETTEVYNKIAGVRHAVKSEEFGIKFAGNSSKPVYLDLERISPDEAITWWAGDGNPIIYDDLFLWTKHPITVPKTVTAPAGQFAIERMFPLSPIGSSYAFNTYETVLGVSASGQALDSFKDYLARLKNPNDEFYYVYPTWWSVDYRVTSSQAASLVDKLNTQVFSPNGVKFDTIRLDDSWTNLTSIWKADPANFPSGFGPVRTKISSFGMKMGLWISPSSNYVSQDKDWAAQNNYFVRRIDWNWKNMCFSDEAGKTSYYNEFRSTLGNYVSAYNLSHIMFDAFIPCHDYGAEEADRFMEIQNYLKSINPGIKYELSWVFNPGYLLTADWMLVPSDDYPSGIVPSLNNKDAYLSTRHEYWINYMKNTAVPAKFMHQYGLIIQTNDEWRDDAVSNMLLGTPFISFYVNPAYMNAEGWSYLAGVMKWARTNQKSLLTNTYAFGGLPSRGEVYGFSHYDPETHDAYIMLRNPTIEEKDYNLALDSTTGFTADDDYMIKIVYPYNYMYDAVYQRGNSQTIRLKAFETLAIHVKPRASITNELLGVRYEVIDGGSAKTLRVYGNAYSRQYPKVMWNGANPTYQQLTLDYCNVPSMMKITSSSITRTASSISGNANVQTTSNYDTKLVVLVNMTSHFDVSAINSYSFSIDGVVVQPAKQTSDQQWKPVQSDYSHHWIYFIVQISSGTHFVSFSVNNLPGGVSTSADFTYTETLSAKDINPAGWSSDSDKDLKTFEINKYTGTIPLGQDKSETVCGDGICSCGESPGTCPADCKVNGAQYVSWSVPSTMAAGGIYPVSVTVKNNGSRTWTDAAGYRLGSQDPQDNLNWGVNRVDLPTGESIRPGEEKTFAFNVTAPNTPGTYNFQWRMVQEFVEWFGEYTPNQIVTVMTTTTSTRPITTTTTTSASSSSSTTTTTTTAPGHVDGDADGDGHVNYNDLIILAASYGKQAGETGYDARADYNGDGQVGYEDLIILAANYGT